MGPRRPALAPREDSVASASTLDVQSMQQLDSQLQLPNTQQSQEPTNTPSGLLQVPGTQPFVDLPNRTNKRSRDDELYQIELEKARLELERQRKTLAFEEQRQANELAFDQERRAHEKDLYQRRLAQLTTESSTSHRPEADEEDEGEIPPEAKEVSLLFPTAPQKEIAAIFEGKFNPTNLFKLHWKVTLSNNEEEDISMIGGKLWAKKRTGTAKDYPHSDVWLARFL
jgi:hypothetical protein